MKTAALVLGRAERRALQRLGALLLVSCAGAEQIPQRAEDCGKCHAQEYESWSQSSHASSGNSDVFRALLRRVETGWGRVARARCETCHRPGHGDSTGITCLSCHAAVGNRAERDGQLIVDPQAPLAGPLQQDGAPHPVTGRALLTSASLCITCHEVTGPGLFVEPTGAEYREATHDDAACMRCHLEGHAFRGLPRLGEALKLEVSSTGTVTLRNVGASHAVPTGVALLRDIWVDLDVERSDGSIETHARVMELGSRSIGAPLPTGAERIEPRALGAGEARSASVALPADARAVTAHLRALAVRADALDALSLPPVEPFEAARASSR